METTPKMSAIRELASTAVAGLASELSVTTSDNLCSSVKITGSFQAKSEWEYGIFHNSPYFMFFINPEGGKRYYTEGGKVTVELSTKGHKLTTKFRKYTGTPEKAIAKVREWIIAAKP